MHARTVDTRPFLFQAGRGLGTRLQLSIHWRPKQIARGLLPTCTLWALYPYRSVLAHSSQELQDTPLATFELSHKAVGVGAAGEASAAPLFQPPKFGHAHLLKLTWAV